MRTISNLSNTGWTIIDNPGVMGTGVNIFKINFVSNSTEYTSMRFEDYGDSGVLFYDDTEIVHYPAGDWEDEQYQKIEIDGGADVTNPMLISWLGKYAKNSTPSMQTTDIVEALQDIVAAIEEGGGGGGGDVEGTSVKSTGVESGRVLTANGEGGASWETGGVSAVEWGDITGAIADQQDLTTALSAYVQRSQGQQHAGQFLAIDSNGLVSLVTPGAFLPQVTAVDNGKVLIVKNGQWAVDFPPSDLDALMQEEF